MAEVIGRCFLISGDASSHKGVIPTPRRRDPLPHSTNPHVTPSVPFRWVESNFINGPWSDSRESIPEFIIIVLRLHQCGTFRAGWRALSGYQHLASRLNKRLDLFPVQLEPSLSGKPNSPCRSFSLKDYGNASQSLFLHPSFNRYFLKATYVPATVFGADTGSHHLLQEPELWITSWWATCTALRACESSPCHHRVAPVHWEHISGKGEGGLYSLPVVCSITIPKA